MSSDDQETYDCWPAPEQAIAFLEARRVLDAQREALSDIDDKALRTVRVTAVLFGVFVATARIAGPEAFHSTVSAVSGAFLFFAFVGGVTTYGESTGIVFGPNARYVRRLSRGAFSGTTWERDYLVKQSYWIDDNHDVIAWNSRLLDATQWSLMLGVGLLALSLLV